MDGVGRALRHIGAFDQRAELALVPPRERVRSVERRRAAEDAGERVVVALRDGIELVVVTLRAAELHRQDRGPGVLRRDDGRAGARAAVADALAKELPGTETHLVVDLAGYAPRLFDWSDEELTSLTAEGLRTLKNNPGRVTEVNKEVEQMGGRVVTQYATLGDYDFVTVIEAPDEQTMAKISVELGSRGTMTSRTLTAMPASDLTG